MIIKAYAIYDNKALQYHPPFFQHTDGAALRMLSELVNDTNTSIGRHPSDYVLYCVGQWDDATGSFEPISPLRHVIDASALLKIETALPFRQAAQ